MDVLNIYLISGIDYTKSQIIIFIKDNNYKHNFFFSMDMEYDIQVKNVYNADEIWIFGNCESIPIYRYVKDSKNKSFDIWKMK